MTMVIVLAHTFHARALQRYDHNLIIGSNVHVAGAKTDKTPQTRAARADGYLGERGELRRALDAHFGEQGSVIYRILNPEDESTPLGKFRKQLQLELDADREGTAFQKLNKAMGEGFEKVMIALGAAEAAQAEREKSPAKGGDARAFLEQNPDKDSHWGKLARQGRRIIWVMKA